MIAALIPKSVESLTTGGSSEMMEGRKEGRRGGWHVGRDTCELEVSKNALL